MLILSQDRDEIFTLSDKGLFKGHIYIKVKYFQDILMGWNVIGCRLFKETLLGTYEEQDAQQVVQEIFKLIKSGAKHYTMPEPVIDLDDLGVTW